MRWFHLVTCSVAVVGSVALVQAQAPAAKAAPQAATHLVLPPSPAAMLPDSFAGWVADGAPKGVGDAALVDGANAAALKEYGFLGAAVVTYKREGETLSVKAIRFLDASGAYGAYSFYRHNGWPKEQIGAGATSDHNRVLFWTANTVVDATFSKIGAMSGSELRELCGHIPVPGGVKAVSPPVLASLPKDGLEAQSMHYALGPAGYTGAGGVLPSELVGFDRGAEAITANYTLRSGPATLTIIDYPTPQMAAVQEDKLRAYIKAGSQASPAFPKPLEESDQASLEVRRSGPLVAIVSGDAIPEESHKLLALVHFEVDVTSVPQPMESEVARTGQLLMGIAALVIIGASAALLLGFFLGGFRALYRIARGKPASSLFDEDFIRIDLRE